MYKFKFINRFLTSEKFICIHDRKFLFKFDFTVGVAMSG